MGAGTTVYTSALVNAVTGSGAAIISRPRPCSIYSRAHRYTCSRAIQKGRDGRYPKACGHRDVWSAAICNQYHIGWRRNRIAGRRDHNDFLVGRKNRFAHVYRRSTTSDQHTACGKSRILKKPHDAPFFDRASIVGTPHVCFAGIGPRILSTC